MSFYTSLSGLQGAQTELATIAHNLANVSTNGFKRSRVEFGDVIASTTTKSPNQLIGSGSYVKSIRQQFAQGGLQQSQSSLDLAISGEGFFVVKPNPNTTELAFTRNGGTPVAAQTAGCLGCHSGGPRDHWAGSIHERGDLSCSDCHNPMAKFSMEGLTARQSISETCATCHKDIRQQFNRRSHMPLPEGEMSCVDCHNPHGTLNAVLLKTDTVNETCYQCHAEKRGPFLFEHAPVRDNCVNCHTPHGSNQHALLVAPIPMLCQQCHTHVNHPNDLMTSANIGTGTNPDWKALSRGCINCHAQIHGSNSPSGARLHQ